MPIHSIRDKQHRQIGNFRWRFVYLLQSARKNSILNIRQAEGTVIDTVDTT